MKLKCSEWHRALDCAVAWRDTGIGSSTWIDSTQVNRGETLAALSQEARSPELMLLHSFLTLGLVQFPLTETNKKVESSAMRRI